MPRFGTVPLFHPFSRCDVYDFPIPTRIYDQNFGLGVREDDFFPSSAFLQNFPFYCRPRRRLLQRQNSGLSEFRFSDPAKYQVSMDVNQFSPDEIAVKTVDNCVIVHCKHEEKQDEHGFISREFTRRYTLPDFVEPETVTSTLSHDGILTVEAPRMIPETPKANERVVPIVRKNAPEKAENQVASQQEE